MNIFVLDRDPVKAAQMQCDKHVVKMVLETAQILCSAFNGAAPYKPTHLTHPCVQWARKTAANFNWLFEHGIALCEEYERRYKKSHRSLRVIIWCKWNQHLLSFEETGLTEFPQTMPEKYKSEDVVNSYRNYYINEKSNFAKWRNGVKQPDWFTDGLLRKGSALLQEEKENGQQNKR